jgi:hypothetical protein
VKSRYRQWEGRRESEPARSRRSSHPLRRDDAKTVGRCYLDVPKMFVYVGVKMIKSSVVSLKAVAKTIKESASLTAAACRGHGVLAGGVGKSGGPVSCSSSSNVPYCSVLHSLLSAGLTLKLFIEGEDRSFSCSVDVSCSSTARGELGVGLWETRFKKRGWTGRC